jgi:hypothetical protein
VGDGWVLTFVERYKDALITKWTSEMDRNRQQADSEHKYSLYFDLLESKISKYSVLPENTYNMDEKGFMLGVRCKVLLSDVRYYLTSSLGPIRNQCAYAGAPPCWKL